MSDRRQCPVCDRPIDAFARNCPFCNAEQGRAVENAAPVADPALVQPRIEVTKRDHHARNQIAAAIGFVGMVLGCFVLGLVFHESSNASVRETSTQPPVPLVKAEPPAPKNTVSFLPATTADLETPITSAPPANPAEGVPSEFQRSDATAVSSVEYAQMAQRTREEQRSALVDPRTISGTVDDAAPRRRAPSPSPLPPERARMSARTLPIPEYQPVPQIRVSSDITTRLKLLVGADGRVRDVNIQNMVPGETARLIATVQQWRFKPATVNGVPVSAPYNVDISFHSDE